MKKRKNKEEKSTKSQEINKNQKEKSEAPKNLLHLIFIIIKGMFKNIPRMLIYFAVIGVISFLVHTYLVIYPNGGYWPGTNSTLDQILTLPGNKVRGTAFWTILLYLITSIFMKMRMIGVGEFFKGIFKGPVRVGKSALGKSGKFFSFFGGATAILLLLGQYLIKNSAISITLIIGAVLAIITFRYSMSYLFLRVGYKDFTSIFKKNKDFDDIYFDAYQLAVIVSMLLFIYLPAKPYSVFGICALGLFMIFYKKFKKSNKMASNIVLFSLIGLNLGILLTLKAYGDDGGVAEAGGFIPWITSPGAFTAVTIGLPSAIGSAVGGLVGIATAPIIDLQEYINSGEAAEDLEDLVEDASDYIDELSEDAADFIDEVQDYIEDNLSDDEYDVIDVLDDIYDSQFGNPEDKLDSLISLGEKLPTYVGDLINSGQDYVLTSSVVDQIFETFDGIVPDWFENAAEDTANEVWDNIGVVKDILDLGGYIPKDNPLDNFIGNMGILKDALGNIGEGDNAVYAGVKSFISNKVKSAIFDKNKNPGLIIMDTLTTIFAGGTEAGNIISPGKTIQGSANLLIDKITDLWNGTDDVDKRLETGHYGGALKVADDTTDLIAEAVYNPKEFKKDFADVITSDEFYDGMYDTNKKLWKPKEGSWAIKRAGCYVGEKTTEGLIKVADGVHELSKWLGSWI
ncbi:MAG TPA: hypothetical protein DHM42_00075 [Clostridiales bacterium]|nr:hypothetical protein [Clostridiales bacterium]